MIRIFAPMFLVILASIAFLRADTHTAASVALADVRAAVAAAVDGDTVRIPAGTATWVIKNWTDDIRIDKRALTIMGAGIDKTIITDGSSDSSGADPFYIIGQEGKPFRICHMTISGYDGVSFPNLGRGGVIDIIGTCKNFRIDHIKFINVRAPLWIGNGIGYTYGLIDHCEFQIMKVALPSGSINTVWYSGPNDSAYTRPLSLGSADAFYFEDNIVNYGLDIPYGNVPWIAPWAGSRIVARRNTFINTQFEIYRITGGTRASLSAEIYDNIFKAEGNVPNCFIGISGGTGVVFNNTVTGTTYGSKTIPLCNDRIYNSYGKYGKCDGTNPYDGNLIPAGQPGAGYPCLDQPGRGVDLNGDGVQEPAPWYEWNNTINGQNLDFSVRVWTGSVQDSQYIKEGREFFNDTPMPGYKPYAYPHPLQGISTAISQLGKQNAGADVIGMVVNSAPLNGSISIRLNNSTTQQKSVKIYNLRGQEVADLTAQFADKSSAQWNVKNLSGGIYFVRANVGGQVHTVSALLQK